MTSAMTTTTPRAVSAYPAPDEWRLMWDMGKTLVASRFLPKAIDTPEKALAIMLKGRELGWPPMRSFQHIHVIEGKPTLSAEGMLALIYEKVPGAVIRIVETSNERCVIDAGRPGQEPTRFPFTIEDAQRAQVMGKDNWRKYPRAMLRARAISEMARATFPDALMGCSYVPEELGAIVNEDGEVIDVESDPTPAPVVVVDKGRLAEKKAQRMAKAAEERADEAPPAEPDIPPPAAPVEDVAQQPESPVYDGSAKMAAQIEKILVRRKVPREKWEEISKSMLGKPGIELWDVIRVVTAPPELGALDAQTFQ